MPGYSLTSVCRLSVGTTDTVWPGAVVVPVPDKLTVCGPAMALSVTLSRADRLPVAAGEKETVMVQLAPAGSELPQLLLAPKLPALAPAMAMPLMLRAAVPVLLRTTV